MHLCACVFVFLCICQLIVIITIKEKIYRKHDVLSKHYLKLLVPFKLLKWQKGKNCNFLFSQLFDVKILCGTVTCKTCCVTPNIRTPMFLVALDNINTWSRHLSRLEPHLQSVLLNRKLSDFPAIVFRPADKTAAFIGEHVQHQQRGQPLQHGQPGQGRRGQEEEEEELGKSRHSRKENSKAPNKCNNSTCVSRCHLALHVFTLAI